MSDKPLKPQGHLKSGIPHCMEPRAAVPNLLATGDCFCFGERVLFCSSGCTCAHYVIPAGLRLRTTLLLQPPVCWDYSCVSPHLAEGSVLCKTIFTWMGLWVGLTCFKHIYCVLHFYYYYIIIYNKIIIRPTIMQNQANKIMGRPHMN